MNSKFGAFLILAMLVCFSIANGQDHTDDDDDDDEECLDDPTEEPTCVDTGEEVTNVALRKTASQSTPTASIGIPSLAVDGNRHGYFHVGKTCSETSTRGRDGDRYPWLTVDLGDRYLVRNVIMYPRKDPCCVDRNHDLEVRVGDEKEGGIVSPFSKNPLCGSVVGGGFQVGHVFNFTCSSCSIGRYVSIQIAKACQGDGCLNVLAICELEVMGYPYSG